MAIRWNAVDSTLDSIGRIVDSTRKVLDSVMTAVSAANNSLDSLKSVVDSQKSVIDTLGKMASQSRDSVTVVDDSVPEEIEVPEEPFDELAEYEESDVRAYRLFMKAKNLQSVFGTSHIKFAFRNETTGSLVLADVKNDSIHLESLVFGVEVYHPQYSPDGSKLAFSTTYEGNSHDAELYVLDLNADSTLIKLNVESATIPRWKVLENGDTAIAYVSYSGTNTNEKWLTSSTWQVPFVGGRFGTPQKIFNRAFNGGVSFDNSFAVTGSSLLMTHFVRDSDSVNAVLYNGEQVCNVSLARDSSAMIAFLDATGRMGREFTGKSNYEWHEYLFFMDTTGTLVSSIRCLFGYVFADTEWMNRSGYLVGTISSDGIQRSFIVLIDAVNRMVIPLVQTLKNIEIWHPDLWVEP